MPGSGIVAILAVLAFLAPAAIAEETVKISGTGGAIGGMKILGDAFEKRNPGVKATVLPSMGSSGGIKAVAAGKLDLAVTARRVKDEEMVPGLVEEPYAKGAIVFATSSSTRAEGLGMSEIRDIFTGKKTTWQGGRKIFVVIRAPHDAYTTFLENLSPAMKDATDAARKRPGMFTAITDQDAADQIERTPGSFGVTSLSLVASEKRKIKPLAVDGISPVARNGVNGKYPYFITFHLVYMKSRAAGAVGNFIDFIESKEGAEILRRNGHIPIGKAQGEP